MSRALWGVLGLCMLTLLGQGWLYLHVQDVQATVLRSQQQQQQQMAELNDRLVALSRVQAVPVTSSRAASVPQALEYRIDQQLLLNRLRLIQQTVEREPKQADQLLALQQQQLTGRGWAHLSASLRQLLVPLLARDRQRLQQWLAEKNSHDVLMDTRLAQLQRQLDLLSIRPPRLEPPQGQGIRAQLLALIRIEPASPQAGQQAVLRGLACREAALTLGLARHALRHDPERLAVLLGQVDTQLAALPDPAVVHVRQQVRALINMKAPVWSGLESLRLLEGAGS